MDTEIRVITPNGRTVIQHTYACLLCRVEGSGTVGPEVILRTVLAETKTEALKILDCERSFYKVKGIYRLYPEDFKEVL